MDSIPQSAAELGIDFNGYEELAKSVGCIASLKREERQKLLDTANILFSRETDLKIGKLILDMAYDKEFYRIADMSYERGPPEEEAIFTTTLINYLLKRGRI